MAFVPLFTDTCTCMGSLCIRTIIFAPSAVYIWRPAAPICMIHVPLDHIHVYMYCRHCQQFVETKFVSTIEYLFSTILCGYT